MSGAVYQAIDEDAVLRTLGVVDVLTDYSGEEINRSGLTVILRWGGQSYQRSVRTGPRDLDVWVHSPQEFGTDYTLINLCLAEITNSLEELVHVKGDDGVFVTEAVKIGASGNIQDPGFNSIARYCSYRVQLR